VRKQVEEDIRKQIEEETKEKLRREMEENIRKEIEERERLKKEELLQKIQTLKCIEDEKKMWAEDQEQLKEKLKEEVKQEMEQEKQKEKESLEEARERMKDELKKEIEEERKKKKEALLEKLKGVKKEGDAIETGEKGLGHDDKVVIMQLFEESQRMMSTFLVTRLNQAEVEKMYTKTLVKVADANPGILKRSMYDMSGNPTKGGILNVKRVLANVNGLVDPEEKKGPKLFEALRKIFDERVIEMEIATSTDIKNKIMSDVINKMEKSIERKGYGLKIKSIFMKQIIPVTSLKQGG